MNKIVGKNVERNDALAKVTGSAIFLDDYEFQPKLIAKILRSPKAHAKIVKLDLSKAKKLKGVHAVICGKDYPYAVGLYHVDQYIFAMDKVRWVGESVAAVAAETEEIAEEALKLIEVEYEDLPMVMDPKEGMKKDAPLIHENLHEYHCISAIHPVPHTNIANHFKIRKGNPDEAFKKCKWVMENEFHVPHVQHVPIETHQSMAYVDRTGKVTIWTSAQSPYAVRELVAHSFKKKFTDFRVISPFVGGGFGGKAGINYEPHVAALALEAPGYYIKICLTREEEFHASVCRQALHARIKSGITENGIILAQETEYIWDCGAYAGYGVNIVKAAGYSMIGPYEIENVKGDSIGVYTNKPIGSAYRGFGMQEIHWAIENHMDMLAEKIGMDAVEFRYKNCLMPGKLTVTSQKVDDSVGRIDLCLKKVTEMIKYHSNSVEIAPNKFRGMGVALSQKSPSMPNNAASAAVMKFNEDCSVNLHVSVQEIGQGNKTAMAVIASEILNIPYDMIRVNNELDTEFSPYEWQTVASRCTYSCGNAVIKAAEDSLKQIGEMASEVMGGTAEDYSIENLHVVHKNDAEKKIPLSQFVLGYQFPDGHTIGGPVIGRGRFVPEGLLNLDAETGQSAKPVATWTYGVQGAIVDVDSETGQFEVVKIVACYDVGQVISRGTVDGQTYGGIIQGLGTGTLEEMFIDPETGVVKNQSFVDYKIPTISDIPEEMEIDYVETPQIDGPYGARGVGEMTMIPTASAISNAIYNAVGIRLMKQPITPEKVYFALKNKKEGK